MFEIHSYEPSQEAQVFNRELGLVEDSQPTPKTETMIATETAPKTAAKSTPELSPEDKQAKLDSLVKIPETTLQTYKVKELRELAKGLLPRVNSYLKADLLSLLTEIRQAEINRVADIALALKHSEEARKERLKATERSSTEMKAVDIIHNLESICNTPTDEETRRINVCAYAAAKVSQYNNQYAPTSVKGMLTEIGKFFKDYYTESEILRHSLALFIKTAWVVFAPLKLEINNDGKADVFLRVKAVEQVKGFALVEKAKSILEEVNPNKYQLAKALALVTGRRSAEIMVSAIFKEDANSTETNPSVLFAGQLKGKGTLDKKQKRQGVFKSIPVLVEPKLVIDGLERLREATKGDIDETWDIEKRAAESNDKYAKALFRALINWQEDAGTKITFKDLRAIYAAMCRKLYYTGTERGIAAYFSEILGHYEGDLTTAQSYLKYEVV